MVHIEMKIEWVGGRECLIEELTRSGSGRAGESVKVTQRSLRGHSLRVGNVVYGLLRMREGEWPR